MSNYYEDDLFIDDEPITYFEVTGIDKSTPDLGRFYIDQADTLEDAQKLADYWVQFGVWEDIEIDVVEQSVIDEDDWYDDPEFYEDFWDDPIDFGDDDDYDPYWDGEIEQ